MMKLVSIAAFVGVATAADTYKWKNNNDWSNKGNWVGGKVPSGDVDLSAGCIGDFGPLGGVIKMDVSGSVGSLTLPRDGELKLSEGVSITLTGESTDDSAGAWRCKEHREYLSTCSENFQIDGPDGWMDAESAPCYTDILQFSEGTATSIIWGAGQYVRSVEEVDADDNVVESFKTQVAVQALDDANQRVFQGNAPIVNALSECGGEVMCQMKCMDACPERDLAKSVEDREDFFTLDEEVRNVVIEQARMDRDVLNQLRYNAFQAFMAPKSKDKLGDAAITIQATYDEEMKASGYTREQQNGQFNIPEIRVTAADLANWMVVAKVGDQHTQDYIRHSQSKENTQMAINFYNAVQDGSKWYGIEGEANSSKIALDTLLWSAIYKEGFSRTRREAHMAAAGSSVMTFVIDAANDILKNKAGTTMQIMRWKSMTAGAADPELDFDGASGAFILKDVAVSDMNSYTKAGMPKMSAVSPTVISASISGATTPMALFARAESLRLSIHFRPTTTVSPTMSPTMSPTANPTQMPTATPTAAPTAVDVLAANLIPIAAGGGGGLILIIIIIILIVLVLGKGKNKSDKDDGRNVVAFENPMYDDPANNVANKKGAAPQEDNGLYDEPSFNQQDKSNPMYQSNEDASGGGGGYLDVQPDDDDDSDDDE